jgi:gephyrin
MLSVDEAIKLIKEQTPLPQIVEAKVDGNLVGSVLADDVTAGEAVPAYRASIVDGYAVIAPAKEHFPWYQYLMLPLAKFLL